MFIVQGRHYDFIAAPSGWARRKDGTVYRDGTDPHKSGPEMTRMSSEAFRFKSHRSAARQAGKLVNGRIVEV